jgi:hypothetical protein
MDVYRHLLRLYPKSVRAEFGEAMAQVHRDLRVHSALEGTRLFTATVRDVARSAPRLRLEEGMAHHPTRTRAIVTMLIAAALVGLVAIGPLLALPALIALLIYMARHADDLDGAKHSRALWLGLPIAGGALFLVGIVVDSRGAGDTSWWPLVVGPLIIGGPLLVVALVLNACHEAGVRFGHRSPLVPSRVRAESAAIAAGSLAIALVVIGEERGWAIFMITVLSLITLTALACYALLLRLMRPRRAPA